MVLNRNRLAAFQGNTCVEALLLIPDRQAILGRNGLVPNRNRQAVFRSNAYAVVPQLNHNRGTIFEIAEPAVAVSFNHNKGATKTDTFFGNGSAVPGKTEVVPGA